MILLLSYVRSEKCSNRASPRAFVTHPGTSGSFIDYTDNEKFVCVKQVQDKPAQEMRYQSGKDLKKPSNSLAKSWASSQTFQCHAEYS